MGSGGPVAPAPRTAVNVDQRRQGRDGLALRAIDTGLELLALRPGERHVHFLDLVRCSRIEANFHGRLLSASQGWPDLGREPLQLGELIVAHEPDTEVADSSHSIPSKRRE